VSDSAFVDYYRCRADAPLFEACRELSSHDGFFKFGEAVCFGRFAGGTPATYATDPLPDSRSAVTFSNGRPSLPFDLSAVATNLRQERYRQNGYSILQRIRGAAAAQRLYYLLRPLMGIGLRKHLQRVRLSGWERIPFPRWPVDTSVEMLMKSAMELLLERQPEGKLPFIWFWPDGANAAASVTHDVESSLGVDFCDDLMRLDEARNIKSAFHFVPEGRGNAWRRTADRLRERGFEVNLHDLNHDGRLFANKQEFEERVRRINRYAREFGFDGFRSAVMYREQEWYGAFEFAYDMSVPNVAHLEPQRGGCCTVMPYFVRDILELPLTMTQDYTLFHILNDYSIALWRTQAGLIAREHGFISLNTHPDYLVGERERNVYVELLFHLSKMREDEQLWVALPGEINRWWRNRREMTLARDGEGWRIEGPDGHRARVAYAALENDRVVYRLDGPLHSDTA